MSKVSFIKSDDRQYNIERCLSLLKGEIISGLRGAKNIVVKPNCTVDSNKLACTSVEALDALLGFIKPYARSQITLAEGTGMGDTLTAFKNYGYNHLQEKYDLAFVDLNKDESESVELIDQKGKTWNAEMAKTILHSDYLISITPPKTHNEVVYTGAIKNVAVGSLLGSSENIIGAVTGRIGRMFGTIKNNKPMIHQGFHGTNENIVRLFNKTPLKLAVVDGYEAMEGDGPINGDMMPSHWAIASSDPLAADWLALQLMAIDVKDVGYISMIDEADEEKEDYFVIGDPWQKNILKFKMHSNFDKMRHWQQ